LGEVFLEIGLVVTSITLLTRRKAFWYLGLVCAAVRYGCDSQRLFSCAKPFSGQTAACARNYPFG